MTDQEKTALFELIETWDANNLAIAAQIVKKNEAVLPEVKKRYLQLMRVAGGTELENLADFPAKWEKISPEQKVITLSWWPHEIKLPIQILNLNATLKVDSWRDSHYSNQIKKLPDEFELFQTLREVHLNHQRWTEIPLILFELKNLEVLSLVDNDLSNLPEELLTLKNLRVLNLELNYGLESIPDIGQLEKLEELNIVYTKLTSLPESFFQLKHIKKIVTENSDLDKNTAIMKRLIETFPNAEIITKARKAIELESAPSDQFKGQTSVHIRDFQLNHLPPSLFEAVELKELTIECPNLQGLPDCFDVFQSLEKLTITRLRLESLPVSITKLSALKYLVLDMKLKSLPEDFGNLSSLETLTLNHFGAIDLPSSFGNLKKLSKLQMEYPHLEGLSSVISRLSALKELILERGYSKKETFAIDPSLSSLNQLHSVDISYNNNFDNSILNFPDTLTSLKLNTEGSDIYCLGTILNRFKSLDTLDLTMNLSNVSDSIEEHSHLSKLRIDGAFPTMPDSISALKNITDLTIFSSKLSSLNPNIYQCSKLKYLRIHDSTFSNIPDGVEGLESMHWLVFERGKIAQLPIKISELKTLTKLVLGDCPLFTDKSFKDKLKRKIKGLKIEKSLY